jgi:hypothetical protein
MQTFMLNDGSGIILALAPRELGFRQSGPQRARSGDCAAARENPAPMRWHCSDKYDFTFRPCLGCRRSSASSDIPFVGGAMGGFGSVRLPTSPCHYGGRRWWWRCPRSSRRISKLYLPAGAALFAARHVYRLVYRSRRATAFDRSHDRQRRLYRKLDAASDVFGQAPPPRPKGTHRKTYARLIDQLCEAMQAHDQLFPLNVASILALFEG